MTHDALVSLRTSFDPETYAEYAQRIVLEALQAAFERIDPSHHAKRPRNTIEAFEEDGLVHEK